MRICITSVLSIWAPQFGGGPTFVDNLAKRFQAGGDEVHVVYTRPAAQGSATPSYPVSWVPHSPSITANALPVARAVSRLVQQQPFDLFYATGAEGAIIAGWPGRRTPLVFGEFHPYLPPSLRIPWRARPGAVMRQLYQLRYFYVTRFTAQRAARVVVSSQFMADQVTSVYHIPAQQVAVIPPGVDTTVFTATNQTLPAAAGVRFGCVARVEASKGIDILLQAFAQVRQRLTQSELVVVGGGEIDTYRAQAERLGLARWVEFTGRLARAEDVAKVLQSCTLFVLPSRVEGLGNVLLEAMACGLPVVASDVGGIPEVVAHEQTGVLVPPANVDALAQAMLRLANDKRLRDQLASAGHRQVTEEGRFTWDSCVETHRTLFEAIIAAGRKRS